MPALEALARSAHQLAAVFSQPDRPAGRGLILHQSPVKQRALELGLAVHQPASFKSAEAALMLRSLALDALVVVAYGLILPPAALAAPALGCFNIHASLLPRWRGAAPIQRALLAGDATTGVSIMRMDVGLDTGPILSAREIEIGPRDTAGTLHDRLAELGAARLCEVLDAVAHDRAGEAPQPDSGVTYAQKIRKAEALIDWNEDAIHILRRVRAFNPWPVAETRLGDAHLRIWEAELAPVNADATFAHAIPGTVLDALPHGIDVACGEGALRIVRLQLAGRKSMSADEFSRARRLAGARFESP